MNGGLETGNTDNRTYTKPGMLQFLKSKHNWVKNLNGLLSGRYKMSIVTSTNNTTRMCLTGKVGESVCIGNESQ